MILASMLVLVSSYSGAEVILATESGCGTAADPNVYTTDDTDWGGKTLCANGLFSSKNVIFPTVPGNAVAWSCCSTYNCAGENNLSIGCYTRREDKEGSCSYTNIIEDGIEDGFRMYNCFNDNSDQRFDYANGKADSAGKACYCKQECKNVKTGLMTNALDGRLKIVGSCPGEKLVEISTYGRTVFDGRLFSERGKLARCVNCFNVSLPWFQVVNGNVYADNQIENNVTTKASVPFLIRHEQCTTNEVSNSSGIPFVFNSGLTSIIKVENNNWTEREKRQTAVMGSAGVPLVKNQDFVYFQELLHYGGGYLPSCWTKSLNYDEQADNNINDSQVCILNGGGESAITLTGEKIHIKSGQKKVIFVESDLKFQGVATKITVDEGGFLAFIVKKNITFGANIGTDITTSAAKTCANRLDANIDGLFIAQEKIIFPAAEIQADQLAKRSCNRQLTVSGSYIGWDGVEMHGTFAGCLILPPTTFIDYNADHPVVTFIYRPDLVRSMPKWMKVTKRLVRETI